MRALSGFFQSNQPALGRCKHVAKPTGLHYLLLLSELVRDYSGLKDWILKSNRNATGIEKKLDFYSVTHRRLTEDLDRKTSKLAGEDLESMRR